MSKRREVNLSRQVLGLREAIVAALPKDAAFVLIATIPPGKQVYSVTNLNVDGAKLMLARVSEAAQDGRKVVVRKNEKGGP